jgi:hypothetical protein
MAGSPWNLSLAVAMIALGAVFAWYERRTVKLLPTFSARIRPFLVTRSRRRVRVAALFMMIGVLMACGHYTDPQLNPVRFIIIGLLTALFTIVLLGYGVSDYYSMRNQRLESGRRALARLAEVSEISPPATASDQQSAATGKSDDRSPPAND